MTIEEPSLKPEPLWRRLKLLSQPGVLVANLVVLGVIAALLFAFKSGGSTQITPLVEDNDPTAARIATLEASLRDNPSQLDHAIELAGLYRDVGELPWSYSALRAAEKNSPNGPDWRLKLGLAYLELGKNDDAIRIMKLARKQCADEPCSSNLKVKLDLFFELAQKFKQHKINANEHPRAAEQALHEILKPVHVDPKKMQIKGPATPEPVPRKPASPSSEKSNPTQ